MARSTFRNNRFHLPVALFVLSAPAAATAGGGASFQGVGDLFGGGDSSEALAVSADGSTVVGASSSNNGAEAFRWTMSEGIIGLGDLAGGTFSSQALGVNEDGTVIVGVGTSDAGGASDSEAFRWTEGGGMVGLGDFPGGIFSSWAYAVSDNGNIVVGSGATAEGRVAFRWRQSDGLFELGHLPGDEFDSQAFGISNDGMVIVGTCRTSLSEWKAWFHDGGMEAIVDLEGGGVECEATDASEDGTVVVGRGLSDSGYEAFRFVKGVEMTGLGDLSGGLFFSYATATSADGSIVVGHSQTANGSEAFIWDETNGMRKLRSVLINDHGLNLSGWTLVKANDISADGRTIVGDGINSQGQQEGWIALLDPVGQPARVASFTVQTGEHASGNTAKLRESDNDRLKVDADFINGGNPPYVMLLEVKLKTDVANPTDLAILVEGKLSQNGGTAKLYLRNWTQGGWTRIATDAIGKSESTQEVGGLNPNKFINGSGIIRLRIEHTKATSSNGDPFRSLIDHVQALVR